MAAGDIVRLRTRGTLLGSRCEFGVWIRYETEAADALDLCGSWVAEVMPTVLAATPISMNWDSLYVSDPDPNGAESVNFPLTQPNPGLMAGQVLPPQNAVVVGLRSGTKGGRRRGRIYFPGVTETGNEDGRLTGIQLTAIQGFAQQLTDTYGPAGTNTDYRLVIYSPEKLTFTPPKPPKPRAGTLITEVQSTTLDPFIRTQRHRAIGAGQ
jgi:hypothetical protein